MIPVTIGATVPGRAGLGLRPDAPAFPGKRRRFTGVKDEGSRILAYMKHVAVVGKSPDVQAEEQIFRAPPLHHRVGREIYDEAAAVESAGSLWVQFVDICPDVETREIAKRPRCNSAPSSVCALTGSERRHMTPAARIEHANVGDLPESSA